MLHTGLITDIECENCNMDIRRLLLFFLLLFLPTQLGKFSFFDFSYVNGVRVDYLAPAIFLSDILSILIFLAHRSIITRFIQNNAYKLACIGLLVAINIILSKHSELALFRSIKLFELSLLAVVFSQTNISFRFMAIPLFIGAGIELFLSIVQLNQSSSLQGIFYFLGERYFTLSMPGIATASLNGVEFVRPYGTFSHPNSMAGFYLLIYSYFLNKKEKLPIQLYIGIISASSALVFISFSKTAIFAYIVITMMHAIKTKSKCIVCSVGKILSFIAFSLVFLSAQTDPATLEKRIVLLDHAAQIFYKNMLLGTGLGHYLYFESQFSYRYSYFSLQPVHNTLVLFVTEAGILLVGWLFVVTKKLLVRVFSDVSNRYVIIAFLITSFFDHYWYTLQQNILLFALMMGVMFSQKTKSTT